MVFDAVALPKTVKQSGIYAIRSAVNGRSYIGSSADIQNRWSTHRSQLRRSVHPNVYLQNSWTKYGEEAFEFIVLDECEPEMMIEREQHWFDKHEDMYNLTPVAGSCLGYVHTQETRAKMSAAQTGREVSDETRSKIIAANTGRVHTPEARANMSAAHKGHKGNVGYKHTDETRATMSAAAKKRGIPDSTLAKAIAANTGRELSPEHRKSIGDGNRGKKHTQESRSNMSAAHIGNKNSPETRAKLSAATKAYWERRRAEEAEASQRLSPEDGE